MKKRKLKKRIKKLRGEIAHLVWKSPELQKENASLGAAKADDLKHKEHLKKLFNDLEVSYNNKWYECERLKNTHEKLKDSKEYLEGTEFDRLKKQYRDLDTKYHNIVFRYEILNKNYDDLKTKILDIGNRFAIDVLSFPELNGLLQGIKGLKELKDA